MPTLTSDLTCPFRFDDTAGDPVQCQGAGCALWNVAAEECLAVQAFIDLAGRAGNLTLGSGSLSVTRADAHLDD